MIRSILKGQRGGVAIITALGFLVFAIPLISGSLNLAQTVNIDARVKADITKSDYCSLAVIEYIKYMISPAHRLETWLNDPVSEGGLGGFSEKDTVYATDLEICGVLPDELIGLEVVRVFHDVVTVEDNTIGDIPDDTTFADRDFQVTVTVSDPNPSGGSPVTYTITVINRSDTKQNLASIQDKLPEEFSYHNSGVCTLGSSILTLPTEIRLIEPINNCEPDAKGYLIWDIDGDPAIQPQETVTLEFKADTTKTDGLYCSEARVTPGAQQTSSGQTALVVIGDPEEGCSGLAVQVTQIAQNFEITALGYYIDYTILVENIGDETLTIARITDLLPEGYDHVGPRCEDLVADWPEDLPDDYDCVDDFPVTDSSGARHKLIWKTSIDSDYGELIPGSAIFVKFEAHAITSFSGKLYVDAVVDFGNGAFTPGGVYSWPTAPVALKTIYSITATDADGKVIAALEVLVESKNGEITNWTIIS